MKKRDVLKWWCVENSIQKTVELNVGVRIKLMAMNNAWHGRYFPFDRPICQPNFGCWRKGNVPWKIGEKLFRFWKREKGNIRQLKIPFLCRCNKKTFASNGLSIYCFFHFNNFHFKRFALLFLHHLIKIATKKLNQKMLPLA